MNWNLMLKQPIRYLVLITSLFYLVVGLIYLANKSGDYCTDDGCDGFYNSSEIQIEVEPLTHQDTFLI